MWCVCVYLEDKAYGGPEEGGWWYNTGDPLPEGTGEEDMGYVDCARFFMEWTQARDWRKFLEEKLEPINKKRPSISSVLSQGMYTVKIGLGIPKAFPEHKPHYE